MPTIELSEEQMAEIKSIREELAAVFIDSYGHMRVEDVIDYLLDTYTPPTEAESVGTDRRTAYQRIEHATYPELQQVASDVDDVPGSGIDSEEMRGKLLVTLGADELATRLSEIDDAAAAESTDQPSVDGTTAPEHETETIDETADTTASDETASSGTSVEALSAANQLLNQHDDKWHAVEGGDNPYEVQLPDGSTEEARTKDDVRKLLFTHY